VSTAEDLDYVHSQSRRYKFPPPRPDWLPILRDNANNSTGAFPHKRNRIVFLSWIFLPHNSLYIFQRSLRLCIVVWLSPMLVKGLKSAIFIELSASYRQAKTRITTKKQTCQNFLRIYIICHISYVSRSHGWIAIHLTLRSPVVIICTTRFNIPQLWILPDDCICVFHLVLTVNCDHFPKQH
jgi:hypothetical protein